MAGTTWSKFFWSDWRSDPGLRACSYAARGLWIDMLAIMAEAEPVGYLMLGGKPMSIEALARIAGGSAAEVKTLADELALNGVYSVDRGRIFSRRMVRDAKRSEEAVGNGSQGGNPALRRGSVPKDRRVRPYRRSDSPQKTRRIFDKTSGCCFWCDRPMVFEADELSPDFFHVDHLLPVSDGGGNDDDNLVGSCAECNHKRARNDWNNPRDRWVTRPTTTPPVNVGRDPWKSPESRVQKPVVESQPVSRSENPTTTESVDRVAQVAGKAPAPAAPKLPGKSRKPKTVRTRLDPSWQPSEGNRTYAHLTGLTDSQIDAIAVRYIRYWTGGDAKNPLKADWDRTWENWIDREIADGALNRGNGGSRSSGNGSGRPGWVAGMSEVRARRGNPDDVPGVGPAHGVPPVYAETPPAPARRRPGPLPGPDPGETVIEPDATGRGRNSPDEAESDDSIPF